MNKTLFIRDLKLKEEIESVFYVQYASIMEAKDGRRYMNVVLRDSSGDLESRIWNNVEELSNTFDKGSYIKARGKLNIFQGKKQFIILDLIKVEKKEINEDDFIYAAKEDPNVMFEKLMNIVERCDDYYIRTLLQNILGDEEISSRLKVWPAGKSIHHAYKSGLLEHVLSCTELAVQLSSRYGCNTNYVVAGSILHDLCKIFELSGGIDCEYTDEGKLVGHLVKILELVDKYSYRIKGFPFYTKTHLKHILLSHHGQLEYGSPKVPQTSEALLVHLIDFMDSKMNAFETIKRTDTNAGEWSGYIKHLDSVIYKGRLPKFTAPKNQDVRAERKSSKKPTELKQNLGKMLEGFKIGDGDAQ